MIYDLAAFSVCGTESIISNAIINSKIACKNLKFVLAKCYKLHIGKETETFKKLTFNNLESMIVKNKLGLSCDKLRASLNLSGFD